ncbi:MAG: hypothetical protein E6G01_14205 [Actinobacteria bacterium]|nr:MAG: hypothetical protein E6G01_14205 [Actinomycetota bacterium]
MPWPTRSEWVIGTSPRSSGPRSPTASTSTRAPPSATSPTTFPVPVDSKIYYSEVPFAGVFSDFQQHADHGATIDQYYADAKAGTLPQVAFVDPIFIGSSNTETDEHPPSNIQVGEQFSASVINSLMASPNWHDSALFFTYDEHGGFYDHVPSPAAPAPDSIPPPSGSGPWTFNNYGIRVPAIVVSPYAKPHFVSKVVNDHTSILRFIELRFGLSTLTNRDAHANPMLEFFNFSHPAFASPPTLPPAPIDPAHAVQCQTQGGAQTSL